MTDLENFPALYFQDWPCQNVSLDEPVTVWADRDDVRRQIDTLLEYLSTVNKTTLHLMWAELGCGKTHTMGFIKHLCYTKYTNIYPIYTLIPNKVTNFLDVYRNIIGAFDIGLVSEMGRGIIARDGEEYLLNRVLGGSEEFLRVIKSISYGSSDIRYIGKRWLSGSKEISKSDLALIGAHRVIKTSDDALAVLQGLARTVVHSKTNIRLLIMIDEFQRLHESSDAISRNVNTGLHTFYNAVSRWLSIVLSFAFRTKQNINVIISDELKSREDTRSIVLPEMSHDKVAPFVRELFQVFRTAAIPPTPLFPLELGCIDILVNDIVKKQVVLSPREIIKRLDCLLAEALRKVRNGSSPTISATEASQILSNIESFD